MVIHKGCLATICLRCAKGDEVIKHFENVQFSAFSHLAFPLCGNKLWASSATNPSDSFQEICIWCGSKHDNIHLLLFITRKYTIINANLKLNAKIHSFYSIDIR